ncbi:MAG: hypothetical protein SGPRY_011745, partial [Prymnesium sp.]
MHGAYGLYCGAWLGMYAGGGMLVALVVKLQTASAPPPLKARHPAVSTGPHSIFQASRGAALRLSLVPP